tara:strand:+ start:8051 stop:8629 length:579 start_codon:yes stop_codon:yes gene_type:complete
MINIDKKPKLFIFGDSFLANIQKRYPLEDLFIVHNLASSASSEFRIYQNYLKAQKSFNINNDDPNIRIIIGHTSPTRIYTPAYDVDITGLDMVKKIYNDDCADFYINIISIDFWKFVYLNICRELDSICHYKTVHFHWYKDAPLYKFKSGTNIHLKQVEKNYDYNKDIYQNKNHMSISTINKLFPMLLKGLV